jgi:O-antigen/teichoic acid export membrane protein
MNKSGAFIVSVGFRYAAIGLQFLILLVIARRFSIHDYGQYIFVLSAVLPVYSLLGLGASETAVRDMPRLAGSHGAGHCAALAGTVLGVMLLNALLVLLVTAALGSFAGFCPEDRTLLWFGAVFLIANGVMFNSAQLLLAAGHESLGAFFYYPAVNISLIALSVPYILLVTSPDFTGLALATASGASVAAAISLALVVRMVARPRLDPVLARDLVRVGIRLSVARSLYAIGLWLPTFLTGVLAGPADAAAIGTAGRLAAAVSAVLAAVRFSVRPAIARAAASEDWETIRRLCGGLATCCIALTLGATLVAAMAGGRLIGFVFGDSFAQIAPILVLLLAAGAIECFGGPVDEVLKMTGHQDWVLAILCAGIAGLAVTILLIEHWGVLAIAGAQLAYTLFVFGLLIVAVRIRLGIWLHPTLPTRGWRAVSGAGAAR